jgi:DNA-binding transcriptional LysR family regulator
MDLYQLECFRVVAEMEHISNAAQKLHVTQPALSKIISRVEDYAGTSLFDRTKGRVRLNSRGAIFLRILNEMFSTLNAGLDEIRTSAEDGASHVRVASSTDGILLLINNRFRMSNPDTKCKYRVLPVDQIREGFMKGNLDLALTPSPLHDVGAEWTFLFEEEILLIVQPDSPFGEQKWISFSELRDADIRSDATGDPIRGKVDECCRIAGFEPNIIFETGIGINAHIGSEFPQTVSFMPAHQFMQVCRSRKDISRIIKAVRLMYPDCKQKIGIAHRSEFHMTNAVREFYDFAKNYFLELSWEVPAFMAEYFDLE